VFWQVDKADLCKLCVHKLPAAGSLEAVAAAVKSTLAAACRQAGSDAEAAAVESAAVEQPNDNSKQLLFLVFKHAGMANDVFAALPGANVDISCKLAHYRCMLVLTAACPVLATSHGSLLVLTSAQTRSQSCLRLALCEAELGLFVVRHGH
jgi:hypothetical protein